MEIKSLNDNLVTKTLAYNEDTINSLLIVVLLKI